MKTTAFTSPINDAQMAFEALREKGVRVALKLVNHFGDEVMKVFGA